MIVEGLWAVVRSQTRPTVVLLEHLCVGLVQRKWQLDGLVQQVGEAMKEVGQEGLEPVAVSWQPNKEYCWGDAVESKGFEKNLAAGCKPNRTAVVDVRVHWS